MFVCSLRYPACNAHAQCCYLWSVLLYNIFPHYLIKGTIFEKKMLPNCLIRTYKVTGLNSLKSTVKFTLEGNLSQTLAFLYALLEGRDVIETNVHRKSTEFCRGQKLLSTFTVVLGKE